MVLLPDVKTSNQHRLLDSLHPLNQNASLADATISGVGHVQAPWRRRGFGRRHNTSLQFRLVQAFLQSISQRR